MGEILAIENRVDLNSNFRLTSARFDDAMTARHWVMDARRRRDSAGGIFLCARKTAITMGDA